MGTHITQRRFGIRAADEGRTWIAFRDDPILHPHSDHAARGEIPALLLELHRGAAHPAAAEIKHDRRAPVRSFPIRGLVYKKLEFVRACLLLNKGLLRVERGIPQDQKES